MEGKMDEIEKILNQVSIERLRKHIQALEGIRNRLTAPQGLEKAEGALRSILEELGYPVHLHPFSYAGKEFHNIIASQPGTRCPDEHVIVLAHFDTERDTPGADDNASGVAALLELARLFRPVAFERTIHYVAVNLEERQDEGSLDESGLLGSRALAAHARESDLNLLGVIVFDTIAFAGDDLSQQAPKGLPFSFPEEGNFIAVAGNQASAGLVSGYTNAIQRYHLDLPSMPLVLPGNGEALPDSRRSDHARFWDAGYKAILLTDTANFRNPHYHQPGDTLDTLNLEFCRKVCQAAGGLVAEVAGI
jgi:Zn-dependent M28 family amino/carboxypeptidase